MQVVIAVVVSFAVGAVWAALDGSAVVRRRRDAMVVVAAFFLLGGSSFFARMNAMEYVGWGIRESRERVTGEDAAPRRTESALTPFAEGFVVAVLVLGVSLLLSL